MLMGENVDNSYPRSSKEVFTSIPNTIDNNSFQETNILNNDLV